MSDKKHDLYIDWGDWGLGIRLCYRKNYCIHLSFSLLILHGYIDWDLFKGDEASPEDKGE